MPIMYYLNSLKALIFKHIQMLEVSHLNLIVKLGDCSLEEITTTR